MTLLVCCTALFMTTLDGTILNVALPSLQRHLGASSSGLQWTVNGYTLLRASSLFVCGSLADRFGRKRCFAIGLVMFTVGSLACGLAPNLGVLIAFRCFHGLGSAVLTPSSLAIITYTFTDPKRRAWAISIWNVSTGVSTTAGPIFGGVLVQLFGWRSVFLVNIPIGIVALVCIKVLKESKSVTPRPFDFPGQIAMGLGLATLTYALISAPTHGWHSPEILSLFAASILSWITFVAIQRYSPHPLIALRYLARPALSGAALLAILAFTVTGGFQFLNTLYLQEVRGFSPLHAGLFAIPTAATVIIVAPLAGRLTGTRGPRFPAVLAMCFMTASMALLAAVIGVSSSIYILIGVYLLLGIGNGLINTPITTAAISSMPRERAAVAGAVSTTGRQIGINLGVALIGSIAFSVASGVGRASGTSVAATLSSATGGTEFVHGLQYAYAIAAGLAFVSVAVALWAFRAHSLHSPFEDEGLDLVGAHDGAPPTRQ